MSTSECIFFRLRDYFTRVVYRIVLCFLVGCSKSIRIVQTVLMAVVEFL